MLTQEEMVTQAKQHITKINLKGCVQCLNWKNMVKNRELEIIKLKQRLHKEDKPSMKRINNDRDDSERDC